MGQETVSAFIRSTCLQGFKLGGMALPMSLSGAPGGGLMSGSCIACRWEATPL
jgi:hypothetical protein